MKLVELAFPAAATDATRRRARELCEALGKTAVEVPDLPGFVVNRLLFPYLFSAVVFLEETGHGARGRRPVHDAGRRAPDGAARAAGLRRPRRLRGHRRRHRRRRARAPARRWSPRAPWGARAAAVCTTTTDARLPDPVLHERGAGGAGPRPQVDPGRLGRRRPRRPLGRRRALRPGPRARDGDRPRRGRRRLDAHRELAGEAPARSAAVAGEPRAPRRGRRLHRVVQPRLEGPAQRDGRRAGRPPSPTSSACTTSATSCAAGCTCSRACSTAATG